MTHDPSPRAQLVIPAPPENRARDYVRIANAIEFAARAFPERPSLDQIAAAAGMSTHHFHRLFRRWVGMTPHDLLGALTMERARRALREGFSVFDASMEGGLSGPSRLHDLFVAHEAMTPGAYKSGGRGLEIGWGFHDSPFGPCLAMATARGLCGLAFADPDRQSRAAALADMQARWPNASHLPAADATRPHVAALFDDTPASRPIKLVLIGTPFQLRVWEALLAIPCGRTTSYGILARHLDAPRASRAVGHAVGRNPLSYVVPCHRVLRADGALGGYHWGLVRKRVMLAYESARTSRSSTAPPAPIR